jgi:hypothetical protein
MMGGIGPSSSLASGEYSLRNSPSPHSRPIPLPVSNCELSKGLGEEWPQMDTLMMEGSKLKKKQMFVKAKKEGGQWKSADRN